MPGYVPTGTYYEHTNVRQSVRREEGVGSLLHVLYVERAFRKMGEGGRRREIDGASRIELLQTVEMGNGIHLFP